VGLYTGSALHLVHIVGSAAVLGIAISACTAHICSQVRLRVVNNADARMPKAQLSRGGQGNQKKQHYCLKQGASCNIPEL
jgi:hypothetical protein